MSEGKQPDRTAKKRTYIRKFDLIGELLSNYGEMTGGNITREIFSYLDFSTLQRGRLVAKSWNHFLANDKKIWLQALEKHLPNLIYFTNRLTENEEENSTFWKELWMSIGKEDNKGPKEIIDSFKKVQSIFEIVKICAKSKLKRYENFQLHDYLPFHDDFVGEKLKKVVIREIKKKETPFMVGLQQQMGDLEEGKIRLQEIANLHGYLFFQNWEISRNRGMQDKILREIKDYLFIFLPLE